MTLQLIHKLRGYKHDQIISHVRDIPFSDRKALTRKVRTKQSSKLIFATHYSDDINRIKRIFKKHWTLIKNSTLLNHIFPSPPVIAYSQS